MRGGGEIRRDAVLLDLDYRWLPREARPVSGVWYHPPVKRLARSLLNLSTAASIALCAATLALWVWSLRRPVTLQPHSTRPDRAWFLDVDAGRVRGSLHR